MPRISPYIKKKSPEVKKDPYFGFSKVSNALFNTVKPQKKQSPVVMPRISPDIKKKSPELQKDSYFGFSKVSNVLFNTVKQEKKQSPVSLPRISPEPKKKSPVKEGFFAGIIRRAAEAEERRAAYALANPKRSSSSSRSNISRPRYSDPVEDALLNGRSPPRSPVHKKREYTKKTEHTHDVCSAYVKASGMKCTYKARANGCCGHHGG